MILETEITRALGLLEFPFMQRALIGGVLTGLMGGILGSFTILRQLSFFSDALGHSALLGISLGLLLGLNPSLILLPFAVIFAFGIASLLQRTELWTDALLNIVYSSCLAVGIIILSFVDEYKGSIDSLLFGDILAVGEGDLMLSGFLLLCCLAFIGLTLRTQLLLTLNESLAIAQGISVSLHRTLFIVLLSLVVAVSIKAVGVLLVSAFVVIPACTARLLSLGFSRYVLFSASFGVFCAVFGIILSALFDLPSGPSIVVTQFGVFLSAIGLSRAKKFH